MDTPDAPDLVQSDIDKRLAAAVLLVEAAAIDGDFGDQERLALNAILTREFDLTGEELETLVTEAAKVQSESNHLLRLTRVIKDSYPLE